MSFALFNIYESTRTIKVERSEIDVETSQNLLIRETSENSQWNYLWAENQFDYVKHRNYEAA